MISTNDQIKLRADTLCFSVQSSSSAVGSTTSGTVVITATFPAASGPTTDSYPSSVPVASSTSTAASDTKTASFVDPTTIQGQLAAAITGSTM